ncbi:hypothetical protein MAR_003357, partial [Mya arenaria]
DFIGRVSDRPDLVEDDYIVSIIDGERRIEIVDCPGLQDGEDASEAVAVAEKLIQEKTEHDRHIEQAKKEKIRDDERKKCEQEFKIQRRYDTFKQRQADKAIKDKEKNKCKQEFQNQRRYDRLADSVYDNKLAYIVNPLIC